MNESFIADRIYRLRDQNNVSAREMSISLGQNGSYINRIENKKALPSMQGLFYICDYFKITPEEFFSGEQNNPRLLRKIIEDFDSLTEEQQKSIAIIVSGLKQSNKKKGLYPSVNND